MIHPRTSRAILLAILTSGAVGAWAQTPASSQQLTIEEALGLARLNNGTVRSAYLNYESAKAAARATYAAFLPTVSGGVSQEDSSTQTFTGFFRGNERDTARGAFVEASWILLESGDRNINYRRALYSRDSAELNALQTLRSTLFAVHQSFYEAIRTQELLKVQEQALSRAQKVYDMTEFRSRPDIGDLPRKDLKQAEADLLNAKVSFLQAQNGVQIAQANLKAILGLSYTSSPQVQAPPESEQQPLEFSLERAIEDGLSNRADLEATRKQVEAQKLSINSAKIDAGLQWSVEARYRHSFTNDPFNRTSLIAQATYPLFDGKRSKENIRVEQLTLEAQVSNLIQTEREATAEIESAYKEYSQNLLRLEAARSALEAARENYRFAQESFEKGASNLIEVLTAQVTLATAESNYVNAVYDSYISDVKLRLAMGRPMPGEVSEENE